MKVMINLEMFGAMCQYQFPIIQDPYPHVVASMAAVHENINGDLQT